MKHRSKRTDSLGIEPRSAGFFESSPKPARISSTLRARMTGIICDRHIMCDWHNYCDLPHGFQAINLSTNAHVIDAIEEITGIC